jgi:ATP synthase subunit 6
MTLFLESPLEQFIVLPISLLQITFSNIFITYLAIFLVFIYYFLSIAHVKTLDIFVIPVRWQILLEIIYLAVYSIIEDNVLSNIKNKIFPIISSIFFLILSFNLFGMVPYTFTISSELMITFTISLSFFIGIQIISFSIHKLKFFALFFPSGLSLNLSLLLVPIEIISFIFKPISLSIRLFANMMAGHALLKVIVGFTWILSRLDSWFSLIHFFLIFLLFFLIILEVAVAIIQAYVFVVLLCVFFNDALNIH